MSNKTFEQRLNQLEDDLNKYLEQYKDMLELQIKTKAAVKPWIVVGVSILVGFTIGVLVI